MKFSSMLEGLSTTKIATEAPKPSAKPVTQQAPSEKTAGAQSALDSAVADALRQLPGTGTSKVASAKPESELEKIAAATIAEDRAGEEKHAQLIGQSMAHGFLATLDQFGAAANSLNKTAAADVTAEELELVKMARANPEAFLAEVARGVAQGGSDKAAEEALFNETSDRVVAGIHKLSTDHFIGGYSAMAQVLES